LWVSKVHLLASKKLQRIDVLARFLFTLETLLRHREDVEQKEKDELFRLNYKYQTELRHRDDLILKLERTMAELSHKRLENPGHEELNWFDLYLNRLNHEIKQSNKSLAQLNAEVEAQKMTVIEASKKRKILASLRSKKEKEFVEAMEKLEQKEVDDLVVTRFGSGESRIADAHKPGRN
jgi:flagellar export protein FliJ